MNESQSCMSTARLLYKITCVSSVRFHFREVEVIITIQYFYTFLQ